MGKSGILVNNLEEGMGLPLATQRTGETHLNLPVCVQEVVAMPVNRGIINLASPYKTFTGGASDSMDINASTAKLPSLASTDAKLIDCKGASHIVVYHLAPKDLLADSASPWSYLVGSAFACMVAGYIPTDAARTMFKPSDIWWGADNNRCREAVLAPLAEDDSAGFIQLSVGGTVLAASPPYYIPTMGYDKVQVFLIQDSGEVGCVFTGVIKLYVSVL